MKNFIAAIFITSLFLNQSGASEYTQRWETLTKNDKISVIAPSYGNRDGSVEKAREVISRFGFKASIPEDLIETTPLGYSNTEKYRANHLGEEINNQETKVIWALRGGRGSSDILSYLPKIKRTLKPPLLVGFSDITALHLFTISLNWPSLHGIVLGYNKESNQTINSNASLEEVFDILTGKTTELSYTFLPLNKAAKDEELSIKGSVVGGNVSLIQRSIGTNTQLSTTGKILFLEDTGEPATKLKESLIHFKRSTILDAPEAVIWGNFTYNKEEDLQYQFLTEEFADMLNERGIPLLHSTRFGHGPLNDPLPFNTPAVVKSNTIDEVLLKVKTNN